MNGISKTIPQSKGVEAANVLYDGSLREFEFHMRGKPSRLDVGDYVYTIWENECIGRCKINKILLDQKDPKTGKVQTLIYVDCPGERLEMPFPLQGHRGTRYYDGEQWPG